MQMFGMFFAFVGNTKVVDSERELDGAGFMLEETGRVLRLVVAILG